MKTPARLALLLVAVAAFAQGRAAGAAAGPPRVALLATGGTIAGGGSGRLDGKALVAAIPGLGEVATVDVEDFANLPSSQMTPQLQVRLAARIRERFAKEPGLAGIVVTHGTDSLEETAFVCDLLTGDEQRPVVFAAAQRPPREPDSDGPRNLLNAFRIAASPAARGLGVLVTLNSEIHAARDVRKTHATALDAFKSPEYGPIGYVDGAHVVIGRKPARRLALPAGSMETNADVELITLAAGSDGRLVRAAVAAGARGLVLEVFGRGNVPPAVMQAVADARRQGVVVAFTTRTRGGRVELGEDAAALGVLNGQDLDGFKARLLLILALGHSSDTATLQSYFDRLAGL
jgi:L-asparaginase